MKTNSFIDEIVDRLSGVEPSTQFIVSNAIDVLDSTLAVVLKTYNVDQYVKEMEDKLDSLESKALQNMELTTTVYDPFDEVQSRSYTLECESCKSVSESSTGIKDAFQQVVGVALDVLSETIVKFDPLQKAKVEIQNHASTLYDALDGIIDIILEQQENVADVFTTASDLDTKYREKYITIF